MISILIMVMMANTLVLPFAGQGEYHRFAVIEAAGDHTAAPDQHDLLDHLQGHSQAAPFYSSAGGQNPRHAARLSFSIAGEQKGGAALTARPFEPPRV